MTSRRHVGILHKLFPIKRDEWSKVLILCFLKGLLSFCFAMLKLQKNSNVIFDECAEQISFVKSFVLPVGLLMVVAYTVLSNRFSQKLLFYGIIFFFLGAFGLYGFVLVPYRDSLLPDTQCLEDKWAGRPGFLHFVKVYGSWIFALFFCLAELYGQFLIILLFWGIANGIFTSEQAKRSYHFFIVAGCIGGILGADMAVYITNRIVDSDKQHATEKNLYDISQAIAFCCFFVCCFVLLFYMWLAKRPDFNTENKRLASSTKMSFFKAVKYIASDRYLLATACLVICCAVTTSLVDITYKKYITHFCNLEDQKLMTEGKVHKIKTYAVWEASQMKWANWLCIVAGLFLTHWVSRKFSWRVNAYIAPIIISVTGIMFFGASAYHRRYNLNDFCQRLFNFPAYTFIAHIGFYQSVLTTFVKYVFFDTTKEMVFIFLGPEARKQGKAAVDVVGSRLGKGLSSQIHAVLLSLFTLPNELMKVEGVSHFLGLIFGFFCVGWFLSIGYIAGKIQGQKQLDAGVGK